MKINDLWWSNDETQWKLALDNYWNLVNIDNFQIEKYLDLMDSSEVENLTLDAFYDFLFSIYFVWKYTAKNRLATTRIQLERYKSEGRMNELAIIKQDLFSFNKINIRKGLEIATKIRGLGTAGASGLLSILFPNYFATVDQFMVKALICIDGLTQREKIMGMKPENLNIKDGIILISIMRDKADELNNEFKSNFWTPRKIDMILWSIGR